MEWKWTWQKRGSSSKESEHHVPGGGSERWSTMYDADFLRAFPPLLHERGADTRSVELRKEIETKKNWPFRGMQKNRHSPLLSSTREDGKGREESESHSLVGAPSGCHSLDLVIISPYQLPLSNRCFLKYPSLFLFCSVKLPNRPI